MISIPQVVTYSISTICILFIISGCTGKTNEQTIRAYNALGRSQNLDLVTDGYIIGIEKYKREDIGNPKKHDPDRYKTLPNPNNDPLLLKQNQEFKKVTNDPKPMLITHITSNFPNRTYLYNAYTNNLKGNISYEDGYRGLLEFQKDLLKRIQEQNKNKTPYTHIFIMNMGWNNDQFEAIYRYNKIINNLSKISSCKGYAAFKPLVIGITWPSAWYTIEDSWIKKKFGHIFSYGNKGNDADEIGYTLANWLINYQLPSIRKAAQTEHFPKVIAIGHSMGARILSRAIFSNDHLLTPPSDNASAVDLFISLQGAFSAKRFVAKDSAEGAPYMNYSSLSTKIILTSSRNDNANPFAFWSKHVGGGNGLDYMKTQHNIFKILSWPKQQKQLKDSLLDYHKNQKILTLDVTEIVTGNDAHNDILDTDMAELLMFCITEADQ